MNKDTACLQSEMDQIEGLLHRMAMLRGWSRQTLVSYRSDLFEAQAFMHQNDCTLLQAGESDIMRYLASLMQRGLKGSTIRRRRSAMSTWFSFLQQQGMREDHPACCLPVQRRQQVLPKLLSEQDVEKLLNAPNVSTAMGLRDRCILEILYATGLRVSELVGLQRSHIEMDTMLLRVIGKGDKERLAPFGEEAAVWLTRWLAQQRKIKKTAASPYLFPGRTGRAMTRQNIWLRIKYYVKVADLKTEPSPHTLRHAFATHLLNHGAGLRAVQMLLGHANISTTEIYTHITRVRLHEALNKAHPMGKGSHFFQDSGL